jgi:flavodoxin
MKTKFLILALFLAFNSLSAQNTNEKNTKKNLVVYYTNSYGNTKAVAEQIYKTMGGDIFEIVLKNPYPTDEKTVIEMVREEMKQNYRPELKENISDLSSYDIIFIGTPIWFSTMASPLFTFLESNDFTGKTIIPFYTCGGGNEGSMVEDMKARCKDATFLPIFGVSRKDRENGIGEQKVEQYLKELKL